MNDKHTQIENIIHKIYGSSPILLGIGGHATCWQVGKTVFKIFSEDNSSFSKEKRTLEFLADKDLGLITPRYKGSGLFEEIKMPYICYDAIDMEPPSSESGWLQAPLERICEFSARLANCSDAFTKIIEADSLKDKELAQVLHISEKYEWPKDFKAYIKRSVSQVELESSHSFSAYQIIHNDLTPSNILYNGKDLAIIDFGNVIYSYPEMEFRHLYRFDRQAAKKLIDCYEHSMDIQLNKKLISDLSRTRLLYLALINFDRNRQEWGMNWINKLPPEDVRYIKPILHSHFQP